MEKLGLPSALVLGDEAGILPKAKEHINVGINAIYDTIGNDWDVIVTDFGSSPYVGMESLRQHGVPHDCIHAFYNTSGGLFVDRIVNTSMFYPCNYGFIPNTLHADGDPTDVLVLLDIPLPPGVVIPCRPIGVLKMEDDGGIDDKIIAVPTNKIDPFQSDISDLTDLNEKTKERISHFFEHYKDLEKDKWVKLIGWGNKDVAIEIIQDSIKSFKN